MKTINEPINMAAAKVLRELCRMGGGGPTAWDLADAIAVTKPGEHFEITDKALMQVFGLHAISKMAQLCERFDLRVEQGQVVTQESSGPQGRTLKFHAVTADYLKDEATHGKSSIGPS